jgi:IclR family pca regulon transcriptional regulator
VKSAVPSECESDELKSQAIHHHTGDPSFITALARGLSVLLALSDKRGHLSVAEVAHRTGIPRASVRRSLHTLAKLGFAASDESKSFYLRPRVLSFSHAYLSSSPLSTAAQPILDQLGETLHEACSLATLDGDDVVFLARSMSSRIMSPELNVGCRHPAYCSSIGHVMLAHVSAAELESYIARTLFVRYTAFTISTPESLRSALALAREQDYAYVGQQMDVRLHSFAVPVRDTAGNCVAGMNVILHGNRPRHDEMAARVLEPLRHAARELGSQLLP